MEQNNLLPFPTETNKKPALSLDDQLVSAVLDFFKAYACGRKQSVEREVLASHFGVSDRVIRKAIELLRIELDVPIIPGAKSGYFLACGKDDEPLVKRFIAQQTARERQIFMSKRGVQRGFYGS